MKRLLTINERVDKVRAVLLEELQRDRPKGIPLGTSTDGEDSLSLRLTEFIMRLIGILAFQDRGAWGDDKPIDRIWLKRKARFVVGKEDERDGVLEINAVTLDRQGCRASPTFQNGDSLTLRLAISDRALVRILDLLLLVDPDWTMPAGSLDGFDLAQAVVSGH